jgi:amino acid adenylation domain-containing protein
MNYNYPKAKVLSELVLEHSIATPNKVAVNDGEVNFTYLELENLSNHLASQLMKDGVQKGDRVCLMAKKTSHIIPFAIAIWKAGAVYSPLDIELPKDRLEKIIQNIQPAVIVGLKKHKALFDQLEIETQYFYETYQELVKDTAIIEFPEVLEEDNAIIIHTSGTTGLAKGVVLQHLSVVAYFNSHRFILSTTNESRCLNTASFHYDVSIQDTFQPIYHGAYVYLYRSFFVPDIALPLIEEEKFTLITAVSTILAMMTGDLENLDEYKFPHLQFISTGAEVCSTQLINKWLQTNPGLVAVNGYGPSEVNSVTVSYHITAPDEERTTYFPIGKAHKGVLAVLIDEDNNIITDENVNGELILGGKQLMHYYWKNEEATRKAFVEIEGEKYYKTGDICFYDHNRDLVYNGRRDFEVKHNGRRINLNEITAMVEDEFKFQSVDCHQIKIDDSTSYLNMVIKIKNYENAKELRESIIKYLKQKLPTHSIPSVYSFYNQELKTSSGKVNRKLLFDLSEQAMHKKRANLLIYEDNVFIPFNLTTNTTSS